MKKRISHAPLSSLPAVVSVGTITFYQLFLRPIINVWLHLNFGFASQCKQTPTCSQYTILQIRKHGTITGLKKGLIRFWNCR